MSILIAITTGALIIIEVYRSGLADKFNELSPNLLVVHESQSLGEFYGSRLSNQVGKILSNKGMTMIIPEIYEVTGTSAKDAVVLRGIDLGQYAQLEPFSMLSGRSLRPGDQSRLAMIGWQLARKRQIKTGELISLRGRDFAVVGVFKNGTYMDNQAWISIADAQALLGWGQDVSVFIVQRNGIIQEGETLLPGVTVSRKGESLRFGINQIQPFLVLMRIEVFVMGVSAALTLTNILWRLAWLHRRDMAILRTTGFPALSIVGYLLAQLVVITFLGILLGILFALFFTIAVIQFIPSFTIVPRLDYQNIFPSLGWILFLLLIGSLIPVWGLTRLSLAYLLHSEGMKQET